MLFHEPIKVRWDIPEMIIQKKFGGVDLNFGNSESTAVRLSKNLSFIAQSCDTL